MNVMRLDLTDLIATEDYNNSFADYDKTQEADWIIPVTVNILLCLITIWLLASLIHYGIKTGKWKKNRRSNLESLSAGIVHSSTIVICVCCLGQYASSLLFYNIGFVKSEDTECFVFYVFALVAYTLVLLSLALFLWSRQLVFYTNKMMNMAFSKSLKVFSYSSIVVISVTGLISLTLCSVSKKHFSTEFGCTYKHSSTLLKNSCNVSFFVAATLGQFMLFGLFIYPLYKSYGFTCCATSGDLSHLHSATVCSRITSTSLDRKTDLASFSGTEKSLPSSGLEIERKLSKINLQHVKEKESKATGETNVTATSGKKNKSCKRNSQISTAVIATQVMKRTLCFFTISYSCDIVLGICSSVIPGVQHYRRFVYMAYDVNAFLNLLWIILSFGDFKKMLTSPLQAY